MNKKIVTIYSIIHFIVDLSCAILIANLVSQKILNSTNIIYATLIYNFFAFAMQLPIGILADKINKNAIISSIGCILVASAFLIRNAEIIACLVAGLGNAMFHIGGGIDVLNVSNKKATLSGIFVSTGAMGIFLGRKASHINFIEILVIILVIILVLILSATILIWLYYSIKDKVINEKVIIPKITINKKIAIYSLIITVCIRSYVGLILAFDWKSNQNLAFISIFAVVFGKMLGGIIGDKIGFRKISIISLLVSAICFIFAFNNSVLGILAILFFNMTMPITLTALSNMLFNNKGMAFGLLTLALFIGAFPVIIGITKIFFNTIALFVITIISLIILYEGISKYNIIMEQEK